MDLTAQDYLDSEKFGVGGHLPRNPRSRVQSCPSGRAAECISELIHCVITTEHTSIMEDITIMCTPTKSLEFAVDQLWKTAACLHQYVTDRNCIDAMRTLGLLRCELKHFGHLWTKASGIYLASALDPIERLFNPTTQSWAFDANLNIVNVYFTALSYTIKNLAHSHNPINVHSRRMPTIRNLQTVSNMMHKGACLLLTYHYPSVLNGLNENREVFHKDLKRLRKQRYLGYDEHYKVIERGCEQMTYCKTQEQVDDLFKDINMALYYICET